MGKGCKVHKPRNQVWIQTGADLKSEWVGDLTRQGVLEKIKKKMKKTQTQDRAYVSLQKLAGSS